MPMRTCKFCNRGAIAYHLEPDGTRTYICDRHLPTEEGAHERDPHLFSKGGDDVAAKRSKSAAGPEDES